MMFVLFELPNGYIAAMIGPYMQTVENNSMLFYVYNSSLYQIL